MIFDLLWNLPIAIGITPRGNTLDVVVCGQWFEFHIPGWLYESLRKGLRRRLKRTFHK